MDIHNIIALGILIGANKILWRFDKLLHDTLLTGSANDLF